MKNKDIDQLDIIIADPAGNITAFVPQDQQYFYERKITAKMRLAISKNILADKDLNVEQVGFIRAVVQVSAAGIFIETEKAKNEKITERHNGEASSLALWHLEMMGGEFCGNAARSAAIYCSKKENRVGKTKIDLKVSGASEIVHAVVDTENNFAEVRIPNPKTLYEINYEDKILPVCVFEGITHIIASDIPADKEIFFKIKEIAESQKLSNSALGVMFYDKNDKIMFPAVYVYKTKSLVFESSCASGSAAFAAIALKSETNCTKTLRIKQRGGTINVKIKKAAGEILRLSIGGTVRLTDIRKKIILP
ncbi:MAG: diaminopimelate epimerase [Termitinemataceae bacterium]|nr:MAG: diaminopimelate epimerase [Termitinemataceae bacterium]